MDMMLNARTYDQLVGKSELGKPKYGRKLHLVLYLVP